MATLAAIKGKFGNIEYYQCTMKPKDLISRTETAVNYFLKKIGKKWKRADRCRESRKLDT